MDEVISKKQLKLNRALHSKDVNFGNRSTGSGVARRLSTAIERMHELGICKSVLDYGTGKGQLVTRLKNELPSAIEVSGYDPAISEFEKKPLKAVDILICLDVLEHIEMESIDAVLADIKKLTRNFCYLVIDLQPAVKKLEDGRNAHILLAPTDWWVNKLSQLFPCITSFPIYHFTGIPQKLVIVCSGNTKINPYMYTFLAKLRIFDLTMQAGVLDKQTTKKRQ